MLVIKARNVHEALPEALHLLAREGVERESRNGKVLVVPQPVTTLYLKPKERVLFWPERNANPFFHFYEALWMLGGRNDVASLTRFVKRMAQFSDDGITFHGAYGHRWWVHFGIAQPLIIGQRLRENHDDRRQMLQVWDVNADLPVQEGKRDLPCNTVAHFQIVNGELDMTVFNRSNDIIWGTYGANAVHFSYLQEFIAAVAEVCVGRYWQVSDNWHGYRTTVDPLFCLAEKRRMPPDLGPINPYDNLEPSPLINTDYNTWLSDLQMFLDEGTAAMGYRDRFFRRVALPMLMVHDAYKNLADPARHELAIELTKRIEAKDWRKAAQEWLERRHKKYKENRLGSSKPLA